MALTPVSKHMCLTEEEGSVTRAEAKWDTALHTISETEGQHAAHLSSPLCCCVWHGGHRAPLVCPALCPDTFLIKTLQDEGRCGTDTAHL